MNRFDLRNSSNASSEFDLWLRDERERGSSDAELVESFVVSLEGIVSRAREQGADDAHVKDRYDQGYEAGRESAESEISELKDEVELLERKVANLEDKVEELEGGRDE